MNYLWFKRINNNIHLCIESQLYECTLHEINAIEIIVTILRANYEISYIKNKKSKLCNNTIEIINKKSYGLKICLVNHVIILNLFGELSLTYSFDSFQWQCEIIYSFLNQNYGNKSIDYKIFSPTYLEHMLGVDIPRIERVEYATKKIMTLALYEHKKIEAPTKVRVYDHSLYKKLKQGYVDNGHMITNHICESNAERINNILKELKESKEIYPIVVYGNENVVRDGTHRLVCLYYLYGNINVPIVRVYVKKPYYSYTMYKALTNNINLKVIK